MDVDYLITGVTGFVGRFVLRHLVEQEGATPSIAVIIRSTRDTKTGKYRTANQRFQEEIVGSSLFADLAPKLQTILVIDASLENLEQTTMALRATKAILHCAANVKHYDPLEKLERDNVGNVGRILDLASTLRCQNLVLLSTCYVHPRRVSHGKAERIMMPDGIQLQRDAFYNDYCYTKWRGEEAVFEAQTSVPHVQILRLSCVGAPVRWDLAAHPCVGAQAHLGIVSFALRGYLTALATRASGRISVVPVDIAAAAICRAAAVAAAKGVHIQQICPSPLQDAWHLSLPTTLALLRDTFQLEGFRGQVSEESRRGAVPWLTRWSRWLTHRGRQSLELHDKIQDFVSTFSDADIRFESTLSVDMWPSGCIGWSQHDVAFQTCLYAARMVHDRLLQKGVPMPALDRFWQRVGNQEPVIGCLELQTPLPAGQWPVVKRAIWSVFAASRKCLAVPTADGLWKHHGTQDIDRHFGIPITESADNSVTGHLEATFLQARGMDQILWRVTPIFSEGERLTKIILQVDHGMADGIGFLPLLQDLGRHAFPMVDAAAASKGPTPAPPRVLPFWLDLWLGLVYLALLVVLWWTPVDTEAAPRSNVPSLATDRYAWTPPSTASGTTQGSTFTGELLWRCTRALAKTTQREDFVFVVPAVTAVDRSPAEMIQNAFVPILIPVNSRMAEGEFHARCRLLQSRTVRFLSWCMVQLAEKGGWASLQDRLLDRVDMIVSSVRMDPVFPSSLAGAWAATTTPSPIPFSLVSLTGNDQVYTTVRSHSPSVTAEALLVAMDRKK